MANKVACSKQETEKTKYMNDEDYLNDVLASLKALSVNTTWALIEASNTDLYNEIIEFLNMAETMQRDAYYLAWNMGWYSLEEAEKTKIKKKATELAKKMEEIE